MSASNNLRMPPDFDGPQNRGKDQSTHARAPICPLLRIYAQRHLRGGLETMIVLAWLSDDARVREIATSWSRLTHAEKRKVEIERLCLEVGVEPADFVRAVAGAAWELGIEFPLNFGLGDVRTYVQQVEYDLLSGPTLGPIPTYWYAFGDEQHRRRKRITFGKSARSMEDHTACDTFAAIRRKWRLSQAQFANLFMTSERTVRRWEAHMYGPAPNQRWLMGRFVEYVETNGRRAFLRRFVRQTARYQSPGRPSKRKSPRVEARPPTMRNLKS
jgi:DNA-binding transcriptional regulator YiaG